VPKAFLRFRVPLGFLFAAWYLIIASPSSLSVYLACVMLVVLGCLLRSWAAGYLLKGKRVAVGGPYAYIRNPLYVGSFIIGAGFCVTLWHQPLPLSSILIALAFVLGFGVIYRAKTLAEENELAANLGDPYRLYARQVPAFLPTRGRVSGLGNQRFSGEIYRRNKEYECLVGSATFLIYLYWRFLHGS
jgi:protein-S-isoprenylcysteine O-methyltransferase Ste14